MSFTHALAHETRWCGDKAKTISWWDLELLVLRRTGWIFAKVEKKDLDLFDGAAVGTIAITTNVVVADVLLKVERSRCFSLL